MTPAAIPPFYGLSATTMDLQIDGNLHWNPHPSAKAAANYFDKLRTHALSEFNKPNYPAGFGAHELAGDPRFLTFDVSHPAANDYRLGPDSPALAKGIV